MAINLFHKNENCDVEISNIFFNVNYRDLK